jgi:hypothetical protein
MPSSHDGITYNMLYYYIPKYILFFVMYNYGPVHKRDIESIARNDVTHVFKYVRVKAEVIATRSESPTLHLFPIKCTIIIF